MKLQIFFSTRRMLILAAFAFFTLKFIFVLWQATVMGMPRLGDDAFTYLWKGRLAVLGYASDSPALQNIVAIHAIEDSSNELSRFQKDRVMLRSVGAVAPLANLVNGLLLTFGLPLKWTFFIAETLIIAALSLGTAVFLNLLWGPGPAAMGLLFLAPVLLPAQGLHYFVPSVACMSLGLLFFTSAINGAYTRKPIRLLLFSVPYLLIHPISLVYYSTSLAIFGIHQFLKQEMKFKALLSVFAVAVISVGLSTFISQYAFPTPSAPLIPSSAFFVSISQIQYNIDEAINFIRETIKHEPAFALALCSLLACLAFMGRRTPKVLISTLIACVLVFLTSFLYHFPGYPAELSARVMIPIVITAFGALGMLVCRLMAYSTGTKIFAIVASLLLISLSIVKLFSFGQKNINGRAEIIDDIRLRTGFEKLATRKSILYAETDFTLPALLLSGAKDSGAIPYPMLRDSGTLSKIISENSPDTLALPIFRDFNTLSLISEFPLTKRKIGFFGTLIRKVSLSREMSSLGVSEPLYVLINNDGDATELAVDYGIAEGKPTSETLIIPANFEGWLKLVRPWTRDINSVSFRFAKPIGIWIHGYALGEPKNEELHFPWQKGVTLEAEFWDNRPLIKWELSLKALLEAWNASELWDALPKANIEAYHDRSGIVLFRLIAP